MPDFRGQHYAEICFWDFINSRSHPTRFRFDEMPEKWQESQDFLGIEWQRMQAATQYTHNRLMFEILSRP